MTQRLSDSPLDGDADRHEDAPRVRDRREWVKEELVQLGVDPAARRGRGTRGKAAIG